jgi:predicted transcriptional regulator
MKARRDKITELGELQIQTLDALAQVEEGTVYDVMDRFPAAGRPRSSTIRTVLRALEEKGLVEHRTEGRTFVYRVVKNPADVRGSMLHEVVARVFGGSPSALVSTLLDGGSVTAAELRRIRALLARQGEDPRG